jgi:hypothetical protein
MTTEPPPDPTAGESGDIATRHYRFGWWSLFLFATVGLVLESMNGLRVAWYVDVANETRRTMFRLAHAHGTLLAIINIVFALCVDSRLGRGLRRPAGVSVALRAATVLVPAGFFAGGLVFYDGDPGLGIALVPLGALLLLWGIAGVARSAFDRGRE